MCNWRHADRDRVYHWTLCLSRLQIRNVLQRKITSGISVELCSNSRGQIHRPYCFPYENLDVFEEKHSSSFVSFDLDDTICSWCAVPPGHQTCVTGRTSIVQKFEGQITEHSLQRVRLRYFLHCPTNRDDNPVHAHNKSITRTPDFLGRQYERQQSGPSISRFWKHNGLKAKQYQRIRQILLSLLRSLTYRS